ncbi:hypothetical protein TWF679_006837 [Orbilia oligospora]|uniref:Uncharacterized protein n=1 Tax=Orbilia oligospora TaxID=2813651 RepID=A0A8H8V8S6_ORBOL|nr:hypothetical protein TWF679_006837 [Orbilia oligospora]
MALYPLVSLSLLFSAFPFTVDIDSSDVVASVSVFVSLLRLVSAFCIFRSFFHVSRGVGADLNLVAAVCRIFLFFFSLISAPAQGKVVGATYFLVSTHPRSVVYRNWEPQGSFAAKGRETINLLDTVWRSPLHQLTPQGQTLKGMEVAAMALFIMATLLPESFGRIRRAISALAWSFVATGWQRLPQLPARQRPRAPTAQRRPAARTGPGRLERFVVLVQRRTLAWVQEQDLAGHMVGLSAALLFALHILSFYLGGGVLVLKRASQRVADGRWTPLINMVPLVDPFLPRAGSYHVPATGTGPHHRDLGGTPGGDQGEVPMAVGVNGDSPVSAGLLLPARVHGASPAAAAALAVSSPYPLPYRLGGVSAPPPTTTGPNAVDITAPLQAPLAEPEPMELD